MRKLVLVLVLTGFTGIANALTLPPYYLDFKYDDRCPSEKPFSNERKDCVSCDYDWRMKIAKGHEKDFDRCPNRITISGYSILKRDCPSDKPVLVVDGCVSCNSKTIIKTSKEECDKCPNRKYKDRGCVLECPSKTFKDNTGDCIPCDKAYVEPEGGFPYVPTSSKEECSKCPNRQYIDGKCRVK